MDKTKAQAAEGFISVIINAILFAVKFWAGLVTGSIAITADAWHTLSDSLSSVMVVCAAKLSARKPDKEHPFGHGRWEPISSIFVAGFLCIVAFEFLKDSIIRFRSRESAEYGLLAIAVTALSIIVKELLAQYAFYVARKTGSLVVKADGWHHRSDALSSIIVLAGMGLSIVAAETRWWIDSVLGMVIAGMIFYAAAAIMREAISTLLGEEPGRELIDLLNNEVKKVYGDNLQMHHFHLHNYVVHKELTLHIKLDKNMTIENGHKIASGIEKMIEEQYGMAATVHIEPGV